MEKRGISVSICELIGGLARRRSRFHYVRLSAFVVTSSRYVRNEFLLRKLTQAKGAIPLGRGCFLLRS